MNVYPDAWEVVTALNAIRADEPDLEGQVLISELAMVTGLSQEQVGAAVRYYAAYPEESDERIASNAYVAEREKRLWAAQHHLGSPSGHMLGARAPKCAPVVDLAEELAVEPSR